jgi:Tfp pilus assembly protein PilX
MAMTGKQRQKGSVIIMVIFVIALLSTLVTGMLQINTEEIQLMQNYVYAAQSKAIAEAGLNAAFNQLRSNSSWTTGFSTVNFADGTYTVEVSGSLPNLTLESTSSTSKGYASKIKADITVGMTSPYVLRIDQLRVNQ